MKRKRTNLKKYIRDRKDYEKINLKHFAVKRITDKVIRGIHINGIPVENYGVYVVNDNMTFKLNPHPTTP